MIYFIKQLAGVLANPLTIALLTAAAAAICRFRGKRRIAAWLLISAATIAYLGSIGPVANALLSPLEQQYTPLQEDQISPEVRYVVVLGSGYYPRDDFPVTSAFGDDGLARIVEGIRLVRQLDRAYLVVSGGARPGYVPSAIGYARLARELGVSGTSLILLEKPLDTGDEARAVVQAIGERPFLLVTSAYHMPRAMKLMQRAGARPIAAPTGHRVNRRSVFNWGALVPNGVGLRKTERAMHEYLGLAALAIGID